MPTSLMPHLWFQIACLLIMTASGFWVLTKGNGNLPWWYKLLILSWAGDLIAQVGLRVGMLANSSGMVSSDAVVLAAWVRDFALGVLAISCIIWGVQWVKMRRD